MYHHIRTFLFSFAPIIEKINKLSIDLSRNDVTIISIFFPNKVWSIKGVKVWILHEKIDKYRKYQINSTLREVVTDSENLALLLNFHQNEAGHGK